MRVTVHASGTKTYSLTYRSNRRELTIGRHPDISLAKAKEIARQHKGEISAGKDPQEERVDARKGDERTVAVLLARFMESKRASGIKPLSLERYEHRKRYIETGLGTRSLQRLRRDEIHDWYSRRIKKKPDSPEPDRELGMLREALDFAIESLGWISANPAPKNQKRRNKKSKKPPIPDDSLRLVFKELERAEQIPARTAGCIAPAMADLFRFLLFQCTRSTETAKLQWKHIRLKDGVIVFPEENTKGSVPREDSIAEATRPILERRRCASSKDKVAFGEGYVFANRKGERFDATYISGEWRRLCNRIGVPHFTPHQLRHTVLSIASEQDANMTLVGRLAAHKSPQTSQQHYISPSREAQAGLRERVNGEVMSILEASEPVSIGRKARARRG